MPSRKPPERGARQRADAADDRGDEGDQHHVDAHLVGDAAALGDDIERDEARQDAGQREGHGDHPVGPDADQAGHVEILRRGPHLDADGRAPEEQREQPAAAGGDDHHGDLQPRHPQAAELDALVEPAEEIEAHGARAEDQQHDMLQQIGEREGGDQQGRRIGPAQGAEGDPLHGQRQHRDDHDAATAMTTIGLAGQDIEGEAAAHDQLAMGEVDQPHDAEDQADAERRQGIDGAQADGVDGVLDQDHRGPAAEIGVLEARRAAQLRRAPGHDDGAGVHHIGAVRGGQRDMHRLLDHQHGDAALAQFGDDLIDLAHDQRRQAERRLVEQQQLRRRHQGAGDRQHLLLAARELAGLLAEALLQDREQRQHALEIGRRRLPVAPRRGAERDVLRHAERAEDAPPLGHQRQALGDQPLGRLAADRPNPKPDRPPARRTRPAMLRSRVDLPAPLGPITATISPGATSIETPRSADDAAIGDMKILDRQHG